LDTCPVADDPDPSATAPDGSGPVDEPDVESRPVDSEPPTWRTGALMAASRIAVGLVVAHFTVTWFPGTVLHTPLGTLNDGRWLGAFDRWDAAHYLQIAGHGYPASDPSLRVFFPGYPLVVRSVSAASGGLIGLVASACLVSMAAFLASGALLYRLVASRFGRRAALASTVLFCWFPTSIFFLAPYSEALFALEILIFATLLDRRRWWWAAAVAGLASATSPQGLVLALAIGVAAVLAHRGPARVVGSVALSAWGLVGYTLFLGVRFGRPLAFVQQETYWHRVAGFPLVAVIENLATVPHQVHQARVTTGVLHTAALDVSWMWALDDIGLLLATAVLVYLVIAKLRARTSPESSPAGRMPVVWLVILAGIVGIVSTTAIRAPGAPANPEADIRLLCVAFPVYPGLYLMTGGRRTVLVGGLVLTVVAALITQVLFSLGYWVT